MSESPHAYILCSTPRTGSTLLCSLLQATKVAGRPESYFRAQDIDVRVDKWNIRGAGGTFDFRDFLKGVLDRGQTDNGVFACRIMWGTMDELLSNLRGNGMTGNDREVLNQAFGPTRFVYLARQDIVAQAISRLRAEQTNVWHVTEAGGLDSVRHGLQYDRTAIQHYVTEAQNHNQAWQQWFRQNEIEPLRVSYEQLDQDSESTINRVLAFVGVEHPDSALPAENLRMADAISRAWAQRFRAETGYSS